ncbi:MAG: hypothetical protein ACRBK7_22465 [Acidimicrobiales bacterium]
MNSEDQNPIDSEIRSAYEDLSERAAVAARNRSLSDARSSYRSASAPRFAPALVVAAVVALLAGGATLFALRGDDDQPVETGPAENEQTVPDDNEAIGGESGADGGSSEDDDGASDSDSPTTDPTVDDRSDDRADGEVRAGDRYRVATALVAADLNDPFLNLRWSPDADSELLAKLPPTYAGLEATGESKKAADGGTWLHFVLLDPVQVNLGEPLHGGAPTGWANAAYVERLQSGLPIGTDELAACGGDDRSFESDRPGGAAGEWYVYGLESRLMTDRCLRVVVTFGQGPGLFGNWENIDDGVGPAAALPAVQITSTGGFGVTVDLPGVSSAFYKATEADESMFVVRRADDSLGLVSPLPVRGAELKAFPELGIVVIDLELDADRGAPPSGGGIYLTREPIVGAGSVDLVGIARPFEAIFSSRVLDESGTAVEAVFSGTRVSGTHRATSYAVSTNDWTQAWGSFAIRVADLAAGSYAIEFDAGGFGDEDDESRQPLLVPFTIGEAGVGSAMATDEEQLVAQRLMSYAESGGFETVPLADEVTLLLGGVGGEQQVRSRDELRSREAWTFDAESAFGFVGPFNLLDQLRPIGAQISAGPINHCAGPPTNWPTAVNGLRQVNIEPVGIDSCLSWFGVSLFLNGEGEIAAVALDRWEP